MEPIKIRGTNTCTHDVSQACRDAEKLNASNASNIWKHVAYVGVNPLQKHYLDGVELISSGVKCLKLLKAMRQAALLLRQLLELEKKAQDCYIDEQLNILQNPATDADAIIQEKKKMRFNFFCSHMSEEMGMHVSVAALDLEHRGCSVWTDQQGALDIDAFGMVSCMQTYMHTYKSDIDFRIHWEWKTET